MPILDLILPACAGTSLSLVLWQHVAAHRLAPPRRIPDPSPALPLPPVTLLKPLKGCDATTPETIASWLKLQYPAPLQILFGVASAADPVRPIVEDLIRQHPQANAQLLICPEHRGANPKVSTLLQLAPHVHHEHIVLSDADVLAPPNLLATLLPPLENPSTGIVHCLYRLPDRFTLAMRLEAVAVNADFWSQVLQAYTLGPVDFGLGAVMALRRHDLLRIGGFAAIADHLADDFKLGQLIASRGLRIQLCPIIVDCRSPRMTAREVWNRQLRWARTIRSSKPVHYFLSILANATVWPCAWFLASHGSPPAAWFLAGTLALRISTAGWQIRRCLERRTWPCDAWLAPLKDLLHAAIWIAAFSGHRIQWRGQTYRFLRDGKLARAINPSQAPDNGSAGS